MSRSTGRFRRSERLLLSRDFQRVARQGIRIASRDLVMLVAPAWRGAGGEGPIRRLGITVSRRVGPAVQRNRLKRGVREWFRHSQGKFEEDVDIVVIAGRGAGQLEGSQLRAQLAELLTQVERETGAHDG